MEILYKLCTENCLNKVICKIEIKIIAFYYGGVFYFGIKFNIIKLKKNPIYSFENQEEYRSIDQLVAIKLMVWL